MKFNNRSYRLCLIFLVSLSATTSFMKAQDPVYSQFMFNQLYFNPAFCGNTPYPRLISGYRNQWPGLGNPYINYYASFDIFSERLGGGIGAGISRDVQGNGIFSKTSFTLMYSYPVNITNSISANFALQAGAVQKGLQGNKLILGDQNPYQNSSGQQEILPDETKFFPDFSAGASFFISERYQMNVSVHHLNSPNESFGMGTVVNTPLRFSVQAFTQFPARKPGAERPHKRLIWRPGIMAQIQRPASFFGWGTNVLLSGFTAGVWFRNNLSMLPNTVNLLAGYTWSGLSIYYSYDVWLPGSFQQFKNYGAHEVTFIYLFQYNDPRKKMKPIKCPKF